MSVGSNLTLPLSVVRATETSRTPARFLTLDSMEWTHDEQVMPRIWGGKNNENALIWRCTPLWTTENSTQTIHSLTKRNGGMLYAAHVAILRLMRSSVTMMQKRLHSCGRAHPSCSHCKGQRDLPLHVVREYTGNTDGDAYLERGLLWSMRTLGPMHTDGH